MRLLPLHVRRGLGIGPGGEVEVERGEHGAWLIVDLNRAAEEISAMLGSGTGEMSTEEILALTRR